MSMAYDDHHDEAVEAVCTICHGAGWEECGDWMCPWDHTWNDLHPCSICDGTGRAEDMEWP